MHEQCHRRITRQLSTTASAAATCIELQSEWPARLEIELTCTCTCMQTQKKSVDACTPRCHGIVYLRAPMCKQKLFFKKEEKLKNVELHVGQHKIFSLCILLPWAFENHSNDIRCTLHCPWNLTKLPVRKSVKATNFCQILSPFSNKDRRTDSWFSRLIQLSVLLSLLEKKGENLMRNDPDKSELLIVKDNFWSSATVIAEISVRDLTLLHTLSEHTKLELMRTPTHPRAHMPHFLKSFLPSTIALFNSLPSPASCLLFV